MDFSAITYEILEASGFRISMNQISESIYRFRPEQFPPKEGFCFEIQATVNGTSYSMYPEEWSRSTVEHIGNAEENKFGNFVEVIKQIEGWGNVTIEVGNSEVENDVAPLRLANWFNITINLDTKLKFDDSDSDFILASLKIVTSFNSAIMSFFDLEIEEVVDSELGLPEGAKKTVTVNKYERSKKNREACIAEFGSNCQVCEFSFESTYGEIGVGRIHVHHLVPVSKMRGEYRINPIEDLIPVCPNCHWMLHGKEPPYTPQELREIIAGVSNSSA